MDTDLPEFRVPVTVFTTVRAVDRTDAALVAAAAVRHAVTGGPRVTLPRDIQFVSRKYTVPVTVHHVMETGAAAGNGYLWTEATARAYPREEDQ